MKIAFCWTNLSGYVSSCWNAMQDRLGHDNVAVVCFRPSDALDTEFSDSLTRGLQVIWNDREDYESIATRLKEFEPDAMVISGWADTLYRKLYRDPRFSGARKIMAIDNQRSYSVRQTVGKFLHRGLFRRVDAIMVPGERSWQLARYLGFNADQIIRGTYGIDVDYYATHAQKPADAPWPKSFVFVGRYVEMKAADVLIAAYQRYRQQVRDPWSLTVCGKGPLASLFAGVNGVTDLGFVQPAKLPQVFAEAGAFVLPSRFEPWGQVIVEAAASGLPIVCSEACGAGVELVHDYHNGRKVATESVHALSSALTWIHDNAAQLPQLGGNSQSIARAYDKRIWCERIVGWLDRNRNQVST